MTALTLHIGMNKTGTSAIQAALHRNRRALAKAGLLYPATGLGSRSAGAGMHYALSHAFRQGAEGAQEMARALLQEIDGSGAESAIVSSEFFVELQDLSALAEVLAPRRPRILVYLRRHDAWVASLFAQAVKTQPAPPWGPDIEAYIAFIRRNLSHYFVYSRLLDRWAAAFGPDALDVRIYGEAGRDVVADALSAVGIDRDGVPGWREARERVNTAPSRRQLAAIDHVQRKGFPPPVRTELVRRILARDDADAPRRLMTAATAIALVEEHAADYADIARRYLGRADGVLFDAPPPEPGGAERIALWPGEGIGVLSAMLAESLAA